MAIGMPSKYGTLQHVLDGYARENKSMDQRLALWYSGTFAHVSYRVVQCKQ
jgi:hypothetical protein